MEFVNAFLGVLAIIGIIVVGGFIIFFLGDLVLSILDPNYVRFGKGKKKRDKSMSYPDDDIKQIEGPKETKEIAYKSVEDAKQKESYIKQGIEDDFFDSVEEAQKEENLEIEKSENIDLLRDEEKQFRENMLKAIEERRKGAAEESGDIDFDKFFFDDDDIDVFNEENTESIIGQENMDNILELEEESLFNEQPEDAVEEVETVEEIKVNDCEIEEKLKEKYETEISKLELENLAIKKEKNELEIEANKAKEEIDRLTAEKTNIDGEGNESKANLTLKEYEDQLLKLTQRLSENEKDFRKVKKEFIPLRKVKKTLESDEKKLRRREAIVAKKKVELYGVNNIGDIDQEKAQKLTQDLDLLEGLKLSVKHCEEVMIENKDRYPLLEKNHDILLSVNKTLKADIEDIQEKIKKLKEIE